MKETVEAVETDAMERSAEQPAEREGFANRKLIRPVLNRVEHGQHTPGNQSGQHQSGHQGANGSGNRGAGLNHGPKHNANHGTNHVSNLTPNHAASHGPNHGGIRPGAAGGKKSPPAETTHAENFYFQKQMQSKTSMVVVLRDGEEVHGVIEWYDRSCMKLNRTDGPNLMIYKPSIKYMYKEGEGS